MEQCRGLDAARQVGYPCVAYFTGDHHPQQALLPRIGYVAIDGSEMAGYIAGHLTERLGCDGEIKYMFVAPAYRRRGLRRLWCICRGDGSCSKARRRSA